FFIMKVVISYPPLNTKGHPTLGQNRQFQWFHNPSYIYPMVPASAATLLAKNGCEVIWNDAIAEEWEYPRYLKFMEDTQPDLVAIETKTPTVRQYWRIIGELKEKLPDTKFVLMGDHVTALPEETMQNSVVDYALTGGDFDFLLLSLVDHLRDKTPLSSGIWYRENGQILNTGKFQLVGSLKMLPFIDRDLTKWQLYGEKIYRRTPFTYTMAGRDCPWHRCTFCSWTTTFPTFRVRSVESVLEEIGILIEKYGIREIFDDTGTFPGGGWLDRFCNGMIERGYSQKILFSCNFRFDYINPERAKLMKKAGFRLMKMGLESGNQKTLDRLDKGIQIADIINGCRIAKEAGLEVHLTIMVGYPWETKQDAETTLDLSKRLMVHGWADMLQATVTIPYPGTPLYQQAVENDWFRIDPKEYERFDMTEPIFKTPDMTPDEVMAICNNIYKLFLSPKYVARYIAGIRSIDDLKFIGRGVKAVLGHLRDFKRQPQQE
ncbi:MAG: radical SAM protein, partial [bacterium]|nr:radical SAM protein [bacterium]